MPDDVLPPGVEKADTLHATGLLLKSMDDCYETSAPARPWAPSPMLACW